jgi:hypothetical protein
MEGMYKQNFPIPLQGIEDREATVMDPNLASDLRNIRTVRERVVSSPGSALWAASPAASPPRTFHQGSFLAGFEALLMATQLRVYKYNVGTGVWDALTGIYSGAASDRFSFATTQNRIVWSQGVDNIKVYDGSAAPSELVAVAAPTVLAFGDRVIALNTVEADGVHAARARWSVNLNITDWTGLGSGFLEMIRYSDDPITGGFVLGDQCVVTKARWLLNLQATGNATSPFAEIALVPGTGMIAPYSAGVAEYFVFFLGPDDVYMWDGASLKAIGSRVYKTLTSLIDYNALDKVQGVVHTTDSEYWLLISESAEGGVFIYDYRRDRWFRDDYPNIRALGVFRVGSSLLNTIKQSEFVIHGLLDGSTQRVDPTLFTRNGAAFTCRLDTNDHSAQEKPSRIPMRTVTKSEKNVFMRLRMIGTPNQAMTLGYSTNRGATFKTTVVTANADGIATLDDIKPFNQIRFRALANAGADFELWQEGEFWWQLGGYEL